MPIHVWQPATLHAASDKTLMIAAVDGDETFAELISQKMLSEAPQADGQRLNIIDGRRAQPPIAIAHATNKTATSIALVSATSDDPSDIASRQIARRIGADYELRGTVMKVARRSQPQVLALDQAEQFDPLAGQPLRVSWRVVDVQTGCPVGGRPVVINLQQAHRRYPDLKRMPPVEAITTASVREAYRLLIPSVGQGGVTLSVPRLTPGAKRVREGNAMATAGDWPQAAIVWQSVIDRHPMQIAAVHNLAIAKAARQDFSAAKQLSRQAIRWQPIKLHKETLGWIEMRQREYHRAFDLPDPPEGWFISAPMK